MTFYLLIGLLLAAASLFFIYPFFTGRGSSQTPDSTDSQLANVAIFRDQEAQLARQLEAAYGSHSTPQA
jgi:cytochrome c-type biogenesis protein CcmI